MNLQEEYSECAIYEKIGRRKEEREAGMEYMAAQK